MIKEAFYDVCNGYYITRQGLNSLDDLYREAVERNLTFAEFSDLQIQRDNEMERNPNLKKWIEDNDADLDRALSEGSKPLALGVLVGLAVNYLTKIGASSEKKKVDEYTQNLWNNWSPDMVLELALERDVFRYLDGSNFDSRKCDKRYVAVESAQDDSWMREELIRDFGALAKDFPQADFVNINGGRQFFLDRMSHLYVPSIIVFKENKVHAKFKGTYSGRKQELEDFLKDGIHS